MTGAKNVVLAGRRAAEKLMTATVEVRRYYGPTTTNADTAVDERQFDVVYEGKAKIASYEAFEQTPNVAGNVVVVVRLRCDFPVYSFRPESGDEVHVLKESVDPLLVGKVFRLVVTAPYKSLATAYRVACEEVT